MASKKRVVLVACGSYNPITNMHLRLFELARDHLNGTGKYKVIGGIISPVSDCYPKKDLVSAEHRCAMVQLAVQASDWIRLDTWESDQNQWTETVNVLRHFRDQLQTTKTANNDADDGVATKKRKIDAKNKNYIAADASSGPIEVKMLCGADVLESFAVPGLWKPEHMEEIVGQFGMVVCTRSGSDAEKFIYESDLLTKYKNNIEIVREWISNDISSTKIRRAVRRGDSIRFLMQDCVIDYITKHRLYTVVTDNTLPVVNATTAVCAVDNSVKHQYDVSETLLASSVSRGSRPTPPCRLLLRPVSRDVYNSMLQSTSQRGSGSFLRSQSLEKDSRSIHQMAAVLTTTTAKNANSNSNITATSGSSRCRHRGCHDGDEERRHLCHRDSSVDSQLSAGSPTSWVGRSTSRHRRQSSGQQIGSTDSLHSQTPTEKQQLTSRRNRDNSLDSVGSTVIEPSPADSTSSASRPPTRKKLTVSCVMADIAGLVRRVRRMKFPSSLHETHV